MPVGKTHKHQRGVSGILEQSPEIGNYVLSQYMAGNSISEIWKLLSIKWPELKISKITISRFISRQLDDISPDRISDDSLGVGKEVISLIDDTIESLEDTFSSVRREVSLEPEQLKKLDQIQRKVNCSLTLAKRKYKVYELSLKIANNEIQDTIRKFTNSLSGRQKEELAKLVDDDLFLESQVLSKAKQKQFDKYNRAKTKLFYKHFGTNEVA
jgi:hypothetical protein